MVVLEENLRLAEIMAKTAVLMDIFQSEVEVEELLMLVEWQADLAAEVANQMKNIRQGVMERLVKGITEVMEALVGQIHHLLAGAGEPLALVKMRILDFRKLVVMVEQVCQTHFLVHRFIMREGVEEVDMVMVVGVHLRVDLAGLVVEDMAMTIQLEEVFTEQQILAVVEAGLVVRMRDQDMMEDLELLLLDI
jgi:hypothetical protein